MSGSSEPADDDRADEEATGEGAPTNARPTEMQLRWLRRGLSQPGGKLPLFDEGGQRINERTVQSCVAHGWAEPWFANPLKPDWQICKLTAAGRTVAAN